MSIWIGRETRRILLEEKCTQVISGCALGYDTILIKVALKLEIPIIVAIPFKGQELNWPESSQKVYWQLLDNKLVTHQIISEGGYSAEKMQIRNCWMIDHADKIIACFDGTKGGTKNAVDYAKKQQKPIIRINPMDFSV